MICTVGDHRTAGHADGDTGGRRGEVRERLGTVVVLGCSGFLARPVPAGRGAARAAAGSVTRS
jgi:hypothetical protein